MPNRKIIMFDSKGEIIAEADPDAQEKAAYVVVEKYKDIKMNKELIEVRKTALHYALDVAKEIAKTSQYVDISVVLNNAEKIEKYILG